MNAQHQNDQQSEGREALKDSKQANPTKNRNPQPDEQADQEFKAAVEQRVADDSQNADELGESRTNQPALEEDDESPAKPENS